ncbi:MAG: lysylphosphatidylglycerol synthase transmembrane domain-containing protein [Kiloniellales bacterium]
MNEAGGTGWRRFVSGPARSWLTFTGKALVTAVLLYLVLRAVDPQQVWARVEALSALFMVPLLAVLIAQTLVTTARWRLVMAGLDVALGFAKAWLLLMIGLFFNQSLPSTIGGDVVRIWRVHCEGHGLGKSANVVLVDRVMAVVGLLILVVPAIPVLNAMARTPGQSAVVWALTGAVAVTVVAVVVLFAVPGLPGLFDRWRLSRPIGALTMDARRLIASRGRALIIIAIAVAVHALSALAVYVLALGFHIEVAFLDCLLLVPAVILVMALPVSIAGWGLREGAMVTGFALAGVSPADALVLSVGFGLATAAVGLPGGVLWLVTGQSRPRGVSMPAS